ncbi:unnamed protein product [Caenorhabditis sp. 36 PRJEB53466]|nr:unnamed protein product [Caenorhabditis sp. 36 PRJEB53466]
MKLSFVLALAAIFPSVASQFHIFLVVSCESYCHMSVRHGRFEHFSLSEYPARITRHFDKPVPEVYFRVRNFRNQTDLLPTSWDLDWISHENTTFYYNQNGVLIFGHYFCPEGKCQYDSTRADYKNQVNRWSFGIIFSGFICFLFISGAAEVIFKWTKKLIRGRGKNVPDYDSLVLTAKNERQQQQRTSG